MDFRHSVLIYNLPEAYVKDAVTSVSERTTIPEKLIFLVGTDRWGVKLIFENEQNFRKVISLSVLHVRGKKYSLYPLVTDLIVFGKGTQVASSEVELLLERFAPVLIVYEVKNQQDVITFRAALNCPEIPEKIQPWTLQKFNTSGYEGTEFSISPFCRFCKGNGHFKIQCLKRQIPVVREAFGISALKQNDNDKKEKEEPRPQSDDQQPINMQSFSHSSFVPLHAHTQVYKAPPAFGSHSILKRNDNNEKGKKEFKPQYHSQQHLNMQRFPHFSYAAPCPQPQKRTALSAFGSPSALKKNDNDKRKKESTPQFDNQQHKNMQSILHSPFAHPQLQRAAPGFGKPSVLIKNDNDEQQKKEPTPKSDDHQQRNMQNFLRSTSSPLQPEVPTYGYPRTDQMPQYPRYQSLPNATPLLLDAHVALDFPSLPSRKVAAKQTTEAASSDSSTGFDNFAKVGSDSNTKCANFARVSSDISAVCRNDCDMKQISGLEATSSNPLPPATNLKHLIPPSMIHDIGKLKLFFSQCKNFKHIYKSGLRYPEGIGTLLRQLRKIVKFNKDIKTKSEEEMKFIAWICLLMSKLQYLHLKKNIGLESFYEPSL